jgi:porphobilinogen synthase
MASEAYASDGIVQRAIQEIKSRSPETVVITDVCLCEYNRAWALWYRGKRLSRKRQSLELIEK